VGEGVEEIGGQAPKLTMLFSDDSLQRDIATYMQDQYKKNLGADFDVEVVTFDAALDRVDRRTTRSTTPSAGSGTTTTR
jgi:oligopeptide transport system substrate-binding protein